MLRILEKIILTAIHDDVDGKAAGKVPVDIVKVPADGCVIFEKTNGIGLNPDEKHAGDAQQRHSPDANQDNLSMFQMEPHDEIEKLIEAILAPGLLRVWQFGRGTSTRAAGKAVSRMTRRLNSPKQESRANSCMAGMRLTSREVRPNAVVKTVRIVGKKILR